MPFLAKTIFAVLLCFLIGLSFVVMFFPKHSTTTTIKPQIEQKHIQADVQAQIQPQPQPQQVIHQEKKRVNANAEQMYNEMINQKNGYGSDLSSRSTDFSTDSIDDASQLSGDQSVYCLTNDKCVQSTVDSCTTSMYINEANCLSALS